MSGRSVRIVDTEQISITGMVEADQKPQVMTNVGLMDVSVSLKILKQEPLVMVCPQTKSSN